MLETMNPNEATVNGTRPLFCFDKEHPGTTSNIMSVDSVSTVYFDYDGDQQIIDVPDSTPESDTALCDSQCIREMCLIDPLPLPTFTELRQEHCLSDDWNPWNDILASSVDKELDYGSPVSTFTYRTVSSTSEQGDEAEDLCSMEGGAPAMYAPIGDHTGSFINPGVSGIPADEVERRQFFKGVRRKKNTDKWTCEIRISKKIRKDSNLKDKLWLGTFDTAEEAARALHVGRFLLSDKKKKKQQTDNIANFDQKSKAILSGWKDFLREHTLDADLVRKVWKLANGYGKNGSLSSF